MSRARGGRRRPTRRSALAAVALSLSAILGLAACGSGASSEGEQACQHVQTSLRLYAQATAATKAGHTAIAAKRRSGALAQLRLALPLASRAAGDNGQWQPLMATLSESNRVPESDLVTALSDQCPSGTSG